jgi:hypothetical protein
VLAGSCLYLLNGIRGTWCSWIFLWYVRYRYMVWINPMVLVEVRVIVLFSSIISRLNIMLRLLPCLLLCYYVCFILYIIVISITVCGKPGKSCILYDQFTIYACCMWLYLTFILIFISLLDRRLGTYGWIFSKCS